MKQGHWQAWSRGVAALSLALSAAAAPVWAAEKTKTVAAHTVGAPGEDPLLADLPPCGSILDLISPQDLKTLQGMGLSNPTIAAVTLVAHNSKQPVVKLAKRLQTGGTVATLAKAANLDAAAVTRTAQVVADELPRRDLRDVRVASGRK